MAPSVPRFAWDESKNRINIVKHGIDFEDAVTVFEAPTLDRVDDRHPYGELRINSIGEMTNAIVVNATHAECDGTIRLISARLANSAERERYRSHERSLGGGN